MKNLTKILLKLIDDKKISGEDCAEIMVAVMTDNMESIFVGLDTNPIEPISQITAEQLIENLKHCEK